MPGTRTRRSRGVGRALTPRHVEDARVDGQRLHRNVPGVHPVGEHCDAALRLDCHRRTLRAVAAASCGSTGGGWRRTLWVRGCRCRRIWTGIRAWRPGWSGRIQGRSGLRVRAGVRCRSAVRWRRHRRSHGLRRGRRGRAASGRRVLRVRTWAGDACFRWQLRWGVEGEVDEEVVVACHDESAEGVAVADAPDRPAATGGGVLEGVSGRRDGPAAGAGEQVEVLGGAGGEVLAATATWNGVRPAGGGSTMRQRWRSVRPGRPTRPGCHEVGRDRATAR